METITAGFDLLRRLVKAVGPYVMIEILLPGGSLVALLLFLYRRGWLGWLIGGGRDQRPNGLSPNAACVGLPAAPQCAA